MKGYIQFFDNSGNHAAPMPDDYETFETLIEAKRMFESWSEQVGRYSGIQNAEAIYFLGEPEGLFPCDTYPDGGFTIGPRGGIIHNRRL